MRCRRNSLLSFRLGVASVLESSGYAEQFMLGQPSRNLSLKDWMCGLSVGVPGREISDLT